MVMNYIPSVGFFTRPRVDDYFSDKLNYRITTIFIAIFAIFISLKQFVGQPIQCWVPQQFSGAMHQYAENYCWAQETFYIPYSDEIPDYGQRTTRTNYYQWVPLILIFQAFNFYIPTLIWRLFSWQTGINIQSLVQMARDYRFEGSEAREKAITVIVAHMDMALHKRKLMASTTRMPLKDSLCATLGGLVITCIYLLIKCLFAANIIGQFSWLTSMLSGTNITSGFNPLEELANGRHMPHTGIFPRIILCDMPIRLLGNIQHYSFQCVLPINMFNEMVFLFLWSWFSLVWVITIGSLIYWLFVTLIPNRRVAFVSKYLVGIETNHNLSGLSKRNFVSNYLRHDGVFLLRMMANHTDELVCTELTKALWFNYCKEKEQLYEA